LKKISREKSDDPAADDECWFHKVCTKYHVRSTK
jgi:hypothetical protein